MLLITFKPAETKPMLAEVLLSKFNIKIMDTEIKITAKLYKCRDTAKSFFGEKFKEKIMPFQHIIKEVMKANNLEEIPALMKISETQHYQEDGMVQLLYMASLVELIEPSV